MPSTAETTRDDATLSRRTVILRGIGVAAFLLITLFWIWAFTQSLRQADEPATARNPDFLDDRAWVTDAEATCAATMAVIDERAIPAGDQERLARADSVDESTADLRAMLEDLRSPLPDTAADREVVLLWLADWEDLLDDRDAYADALRRDAAARFLTTEKFGDPLDRVIEIFASVNEMPACGPAGDVG